MRVTKIEEPPTFSPIKVEIVIETKEEHMGLKADLMSWCTEQNINAIRGTRPKRPLLSGIASSLCSALLS